MVQRGVVRSGSEWSGADRSAERLILPYPYPAPQKTLAFASHTYLQQQEQNKIVAIMTNQPGLFIFNGIITGH